MKLEHFTLEVYYAILDLYIAVCGGKYLATSLRNEDSYNNIMSEFKVRSSVERRLGSNICSFSKLWFRISTDTTISIVFDARLTAGEREYLLDKEAAITKKFNDAVADILTGFEFERMMKKFEESNFTPSTDKRYLVVVQSYPDNLCGVAPGEFRREVCVGILELMIFPIGEESFQEIYSPEDLFAVIDEDDGAFKTSHGWITVINKSVFIDVMKKGLLKISECRGFVETD